MSIVKLKNPPSVISSASVVGKKEFDGPLGDLFDLHDEKDDFGQKSWEQSEAEMQRLALNLALAKGETDETALDAIFAGDLINQCTSSNYGLLSYQVPFFGLYGACSTCAEGLTLAAMLISGGIYRRCAAVTSSHNCSAERQFRFPLEYGGQRTPTAQWTVTGAGAFILDAQGNGPYITEVMPGISMDRGITDINNMGAAMAPAAADTLERYFRESHADPASFDRIITGDLGYEGHGIVLDLLKEKGYDISANYNDCGLLIYSRTAQDMHAGGSGCGCSATVLSAYLMRELKTGAMRNILFLVTGALMSPMAVLQKQSIPGIAHLVHLSGERNAQS